MGIHGSIGIVPKTAVALSFAGNTDKRSTLDDVTASFQKFSADAVAACFSAAPAKHVLAVVLTKPLYRTFILTYAKIGVL